MNFRVHVEPPEPIRSLEVPPGGRGSPRWREASAGRVVTGDEVELDIELNAEPPVVVEPADFALALDADPVARAAYDRPRDLGQDLPRGGRGLPWDCR